LVRHNTTLKELHLWDCGIGSDGAVEIGRVLSVNATLEVLDLFKNDRIGNDGAIALADGLAKNENLKRLILYNGGIGNKGVAALGGALKTKTNLEILDLGPNTEIRREGVGVLAGRLSWNTSLLELGLSVRLVDTRINGHLQANKFVELYRERKHQTIFYKLWPDIYAQVSNHPAALHLVLKETNMDEIISNQLLPQATTKDQIRKASKDAS
jgi:Ran GTPase-activating protein (RanGAP) involved in mRNA processing and transport